jgi:outer membrane protein assembly factor BamB
VDSRTFVAGCDSALHVIDTTKGREVAAVELGGQVGATAAVVGERLYVGTMTNQVLAVDWKNRKVLWEYENDKQPQPFASSPAVTDDLVIIGGQDRLVHALDRQSGKARWTFPTRKKVNSSPVVVGQRVFVASMDGNLYVLDLKSGQERQRFELGQRMSASPAVGGGCLVIGTEDGMLYCLGKKE